MPKLINIGNRIINLDQLAYTNGDPDDLTLYFSGMAMAYDHGNGGMDIFYSRESFINEEAEALHRYLLSQSVDVLEWSATQDQIEAME